MEYEIATPPEVIGRRELEHRERLLAEQADQFAEERARLMERVRVAEAQKASALSAQVEILDHHKARAAAATKSLARSRLRLVADGVEAQRLQHLELANGVGQHRHTTALHFEDT